jgi:hypothetical protein
VDPRVEPEDDGIRSEILKRNEAAGTDSGGFVVSREEMAPGEGADAT